MRTADRILADGLRPPFRTDQHARAAAMWKEETAELVETLRTCPVLVADNVAAYTRNQDGYVLEEFPSLAPPWPTFWIEYPSASGRERRGVLVRDVTNEKRSREGAFEGAVNDARSNGYDGEIRWIVDLAVCIESADHKTGGPLGWLVLALDPLGRCQGNRWVLGTPYGAQVVDGEAGHQSIPDDSWVMAAALPALQTMAFLLVKNVKLETVTPSHRLSAKHRKRTGRPLLRYQQLRLEIPRRPGEGGGNGSFGAPSLHIVAGTFAHHGNCCPGVHPPRGLLFGKYMGVYWKPSHLRGNAHSGVVRTDWEPVVNQGGKS